MCNMLGNMLNNLAEAIRRRTEKKNNLATGQMTFTPPPMPFLDHLTECSEALRLPNNLYTA